MEGPYWYTSGRTMRIRKGLQEFEEDSSQPGGAEEEVGFVDLWDNVVGKEEMYVRDDLHLSGKGLPFFPRDFQGRLPVAWVKYDI